MPASPVPKKMMLSTKVECVLFLVCFLQTFVYADVVKYFTLEDRSRLVEMVTNNGTVRDCAVLANRDVITVILQDIPQEQIQEQRNDELNIKINTCHDLHRNSTSSPLRRKRWSRIYPGTKWCGRGNVSNSYNDLGEHRETDVCCREHDHCPDWILPLDTRYGLKNWSPIFVKFPCWCDESFYSCLKNSSEEAAANVGGLYFNTLGTECFTDVNPRQCVEWDWLRSCTRYEVDTTRTVRQFVDNRSF